MINSIAFQDYLRSKYSENTVSSYQREIVKFLDAFKKPVEEISTKEIVMYLHQLRRKEYSSNTIHRVLASIKAIYNFLSIEKEIDFHPCKRMKVLHKKENMIDFQLLYTPGELDLILEREERYSFLKDRNRLIISLMIYQGLTAENIVNLKSKDFDLLDQTVYVRKTAKYNARVLRLRPIQTEFLQAFLDNHHFGNRNTHIIINKLGKQITIDGVCSIIDQQKNLFPEKELSIRRIRQSVIANWLNVYNMPLEDVQLMAGHHFPSSTFRYKRPDVNYMVSMADQFHPINAML